MVSRTIIKITQTALMNVGAVFLCNAGTGRTERNVSRKQLEQADDLEEFDFEDGDSEEIESEDYSEDKEE